MTLRPTMIARNATYCDDVHCRPLSVCRGKSGRLYADVAMALYDCEQDALIETDEPGVYQHPHTGCYIVRDN